MSVRILSAVAECPVCKRQEVANTDFAQSDNCREARATVPGGWKYLHGLCRGGLLGWYVCSWACAEKLAAEMKAEATGV